MNAENNLSKKIHRATEHAIDAILGDDLLMIAQSKHNLRWWLQLRAHQEKDMSAQNRRTKYKRLQSVAS